MAWPPLPTQSYLKHGDPVPGRPGWGVVLQGRVPAPLDLLSVGFLSLICGARCSPQRPLPPTVLTDECRRLGPAVINCCAERGPSFFHLLIYISTPFGLRYSHLAQGPRSCWLSPAQGQRVQARKLSNYHSRFLTAPHAALKACWCPCAGWGYSSAGTSLWPSWMSPDRFVPACLPWATLSDPIVQAGPGGNTAGRASAAMCSCSLTQP